MIAVHIATITTAIAINTIIFWCWYNIIIIIIIILRYIIWWKSEHWPTNTFSIEHNARYFTMHT